MHLFYEFNVSFNIKYSKLVLIHSELTFQVKAKIKHIQLDLLCNMSTKYLAKLYSSSSQKITFLRANLIAKLQRLLENPRFLYFIIIIIMRRVGVVCVVLVYDCIQQNVWHIWTYSES